MKFRTALILFLALVSGLPATAQTAEEVVAKSLAARGGVARLKAMQGQRVTGKISFGPGAEGPFVVEFKRPGKFHMEMTFDGKKIVRSFDGKSSGWIVNPFGGNLEAQAMSEADVQNIREESDFDGPFLDYKAKGNQIELAGKEAVEGKDAWRIKLTTKNGDVRFYFFDASTFLLVKWEGKRKADGKEYDVESFFHDYRDVGGFKYAFEIVSDSPGTDQSQKILVDKIEVDPAFDEAHFEKP
jgi:outer membrane lipoprotein-sorting protein